MIAITFCISYFEVKYPSVNFIEVVSAKFLTGNSLKILQISDYHNSKLNDFVLKNIKRLAPDIIVITGDLIDERTKSYENVYRLVEEAIMINSNIYFISGNHEWKNGNILKLLQGLAKRKIKILNNKNVTININDYKVNICGVDDFHTNHSDLNKAVQGIDKDILTVMLSHSPDVIKKLYNKDADIILSGHTHGGQVRLPFLGAIVAPGQGILPKYSKGIYKLRKDTVLYIDSGLGTSKIPEDYLIGAN
jgi:predicted MPP superfamily phosphohydrolase